jgi:O-antigen/teichoic acid export membrane protein
MIRGSGWMVLMRWIMRAIGLSSTLILARLLTPDDFGVVAMGLVLVGFLEVVGATNFDLAIISTPDPTRAHYDTAWTLQILSGLILGVAMILAAPLAAAYFAEPRLIALVRVLSLRSLLLGFVNIGIVDFRKSLNFAREFRFHASLKFLTAGTTVGLAFVLKDYWALIIGLVFGAAAEVALSFAMHPYRPRPSLARTAEIWSFSRWMVVFHTGTFARSKLDEIVIGGLSGATSLGTYHVASEFSTMPTNEVVMPLGRALFPGYARITYDPRTLAASFVEVLGLVTTFCFALGVGLAVTAEEFAMTVLGAKWRGTVPLIEWLALFGMLSGLGHCCGIFLIASGRARANAFLAWLHVLVLAPALVLAGPGVGLVGIAAIRTLVAGLMLTAALCCVTRASAVSAGQILGVLWRPAIASLLVAVAVKSCSLDGLGPPMIALGVHVLLGAIVFSTATLSLWWLAGRPDGVERLLFRHAAYVLQGR